ncbi:tripartite motif-containing protein 35 isoform X1 [Rhinatrema bivittatum]|uniref:tripartite motif-containing protein 35 isoform X1 n=1 Tax=Rhinatrema bivittatum TaxID=194408 RepID=UPI0011276B6E|nr:tripartite motif-containing protein 35 isoform X1 [Rhinatrema bivittatum]
MATGSFASLLRQELQCPVCYEPFHDAVTLACGHSFCRQCVKRDRRRKAPCPLCRQVVARDELCTNRTLSNLTMALVCEEAQQEQQQREDEGTASCSLHPTQALILFCLQDKLVLCGLCQLAEQHRGHTLRPVPDIARDYRAKWKSLESSLRVKLKSFDIMKMKYFSLLEHNQSEATRVQELMKREFEKLHEFLHREEKIALSNVEEEQNEKQKLVEEKMKKILEGEMFLKLEIDRVQAQQKENDVLFLMKHENKKRRFAFTVAEPKTIPPGMMIDTARHLGSLHYRVWEKIRNSIKVVPFTFDPITAACCLTISDDFTSVTNTGYNVESYRVKYMGINPEQFTGEPCILGSTGFSKGSHHWEVDIGGIPHWRVGISRKHNGQKKSEDHGPWYIDYSEVFEPNCWIFTSSNLRLELKSPVKRLRVELDCDEGELSFYDGDEKSHIYTFHENFSEIVFPYFLVGGSKSNAPSESLRICPIKIVIKDEYVP